MNWVDSSAWLIDFADEPTGGVDQGSSLIRKFRNCIEPV